jgi:hypothetical protein
MYFSRMRVITIVGIAGLICGFLSWHYERPRLELSTKSLDFGPVALGERETREVNVVNIGRSVLKIREIRRSCTCTDVRIERHEIASGESAKLYVTITGDGRAESIARVIIESNDSIAPRQVIDVAYEDGRRVLVEPAQFDMGLVRRPELPLERSVQLTFRPDFEEARELDGITASCGSPFISVRLARASEHVYDVAAWLDISVPSGEILDEVEVRNGSGQLLYVIPFYAYVPSNVVALIEPIVFSGSDGVSTAELLVSLRDEAGVAMIEDVRASETLARAVQFEFSKEFTGSTVIVLHCGAGEKDVASSGRAYIEICIKCATAGSEAIRVPVIIGVKPSRSAQS